MALMPIEDEYIPIKEYIIDGIAAGSALYCGHLIEEYFQQIPEGISFISDTLQHYLINGELRIGAALIGKIFSEETAEILDESYDKYLSYEQSHKNSKHKGFSHYLMTELLSGGKIKIPFSDKYIDIYGRGGKILHKTLSEENSPEIYNTAIKYMKDSEYWDDDIDNIFNTTEIELLLNTELLDSRELATLYQDNDTRKYTVAISPYLTEEDATLLTIRFLDKIYKKESSKDPYSQENLSNMYPQEEGFISLYKAAKTMERHNAKATATYLGTYPTKNNELVLKCLKYEQDGNDFLEDYRKGIITTENIKHVHFLNELKATAKYIYNRIRKKENDLYTLSLTYKTKYDIEKAIIIAGLTGLLF